MSPAGMRAVVERYIDAYNRKDIGGMLETVHPDIEFTNISGGTVSAHATGIADLTALAEQSLPLFSERRQDLLSFETDGSCATASIAFCAVVADDRPNGLKKGQVLQFSGRSECEFRDGSLFRITDIS